ncbi:MAG: NAC family transcription factor [Chloroflexi bacterium]|nr:NAC family transcription factor [Chloroflexota bacterium]
MRIHTLNVGGDQVGIIGLREIIAEVKALGLADESEIKKELLERVERHNYVISREREAYRHALWQEYRRSE